MNFILDKRFLFFSKKKKKYLSFGISTFFAFQLRGSEREGEDILIQTCFTNMVKSKGAHFHCDIFPIFFFLLILYLNIVPLLRC